MAAISRSLLPDTADVSPAGRLTIAGCDVLELAADFGTPLFVYDEAHMRARCHEATAAFGAGNVDLRHEGLSVHRHGPPRPRGGPSARRGHGR